MLSHRNCPNDTTGLPMRLLRLCLTAETGRQSCKHIYALESNQSSLPFVFPYTKLHCRIR